MKLLISLLKPKVKETPIDVAPSINEAVSTLFIAGVGVIVGSIPPPPCAAPFNKTRWAAKP
jgi:hypothetical protein